MRVLHGFHHGLARLELHPFLVIIADAERVAALDDAGEFPAHRPVPKAGDYIQEGGLSGGVAADDAHAVVALKVVCEVPEVAFALPGEGDVLAVDDLVAKVGAPLLHFGHIDLLHKIAVLGPLLDGHEGLLAVFRLAASGAGRGVDPFQFPAEGVAHLLGFGIIKVDALLALLQEVQIIAPVDVDAAAVQFHHGVAHAVQEIAVVRHHEKGASVVLEAAFQQFDGFHVKVVRGLVHYVEIGLGGQHLHKGDALDFPAREVLHLPVDVRERELVQELLHAPFVLPEVVLIQMLRPLYGGVHYLAEDGFLRVIGVVLLQEGDADVLEEENATAAVGTVLAGQDP